MPITYVGGTSGSGTGASYTISLNGTLTGGSDTSPSVGDVIVVISAFGNTASVAPTVTGNNNGAYIGLHAALHVNDTWDTEFRSFYEVQASVVDTQLTVTRASNAAYGGATVVHVWRGVDNTTPIDVTTVTATGTNASRPDPAAITPVTAGAVILAGGAGTQTTAGSAFTIPSGMNNGVSVFSNGTTSDTGVFICSFTTWTSGAYNPAAATGGTTSTSSSWAASTIALRPEPQTQDLTPSLFTNTNTFYAATITQTGGAQDLSPSLFTNTNTFYAATVALGPAPQTLTAGLYTDPDTFYSASVTTSYTLQPSLYTNSNTFYSATVNVGTVTLTANLYENSNTFYSPVLTQGGGPQLINVSLFENANTFYSPRIDISLFANLYPNTQEFYEANVAASYALTADRFDNSQQFYEPTIEQGGGTQTLTAYLFSNTSTFYAATVELGGAAQYLVAQRLQNVNQFYPLFINRQLAENVLQGYFENRQRPAKKQEVKLPDYDEELAVLLLMS